MFVKLSNKGGCRPACGSDARQRRVINNLLRSRWIGNILWHEAGAKYQQSPKSLCYGYVDSVLIILYPKVRPHNKTSQNRGRENLRR